PEHRGDSVRVETSGRINPGPFRLSVLRKKNKQAVATFLTHPDDKGKGGWFLMLMAPPEADENAPKLKREVTLVLDRSGSMAGEKLDQARAAALQVVEGLEPDDHFNLIVYNEAISKFAEGAVEASRENVLKARKFINSIRVSGGTNIHGALKAAITQPPVEGTLPIVLFLTDGLPTIGVTSEKRIRENIAKHNRLSRRIFTFGVGVDVNTPLLSRLADDTRATASFVLPREKVELKVAQVFRRLAGPVLAKPDLVPVDAAGEYDSSRVDDVVPHDLPDFFADGQVIVTGRYLGKKPLRFRLVGDDGDKQRSFRFDFDPKGKRDPFVPRLWATRKIAVLTDALRDLGADTAMRGLTGDGIDRNDPRVKELVDEIVRLSTEHGILTEYTAFLARDGEVFRPQAERRETARDHYVEKAIRQRSGASSVNQDWNLSKQKIAGSLNPTNRFLNEDLVEEEIANVQQNADMAFYKKGDAWIDSRAISDEAARQPAVEVAIGSKDFDQLVDKLVATGRQSCLNLGTGLEVVVDDTRYRIR
ncbi:MAG: VWA domain-containing protein, partial [Akkermansiaceae bacterium]|nr:VWA domain-containing protein [Akkermansiaceae bacterium]